VAMPAVLTVVAAAVVTERWATALQQAAPT
jgi:hypothetical protein